MHASSGLVSGRHNTFVACFAHVHAPIRYSTVLLVVKTVPQRVKIKIYQTLFPTSNLFMNYGLQMKAMSVIEIMSRQIGKIG